MIWFFIAYSSGYTVGPKNVWDGWFLAWNQSYHQNWVPFILPYKFRLIFVGMKQKNISKNEKKYKMADSKKTLIFSKPEILNFFSKISGIGPWVSRIFFSCISKKIIKIYRVEWIWLNFYDYSGFKPKIIHPKHFWPRNIAF